MRTLKFTRESAKIHGCSWRQCKQGRLDRIHVTNRSWTGKLNIAWNVLAASRYLLYEIKELVIRWNEQWAWLLEHSIQCIDCPWLGLYVPILAWGPYLNSSDPQSFRWSVGHSANSAFHTPMWANELMSSWLVEFSVQRDQQWHRQVHTLRKTSERTSEAASMSSAIVVYIRVDILLFRSLIDIARRSTLGWFKIDSSCNMRHTQ